LRMFADLFQGFATAEGSQCPDLKASTQG
jgi:hypothetical protein